MASGTIQQPMGLYEVDTGIDGVVGYRYGELKIVRVYNVTVTNTQQGYVTIGILPEALRPSTRIQFCMYDNSSSSYATSTVIQSKIDDTNRKLEVWIFSDKLSVKPTGIVCYV